MLHENCNLVIPMHTCACEYYMNAGKWVKRCVEFDIVYVAQVCCAAAAFERSANMCALLCAIRKCDGKCMQTYIVCNVLMWLCVCVCVCKDIRWEMREISRYMWQLWRTYANDGVQLRTH